MAKRKEGVSDEMIVETYLQCRSAEKTAKMLGVSDSTVYRILREKKIQRDGLTRFRKSITKFQGKEAEIRAAYEGGATMLELRKLYGDGTHYAFKHAIKRAGGCLRQANNPLIKPEEFNKIKELRAMGCSQAAIAVELGRSQSLISRVLVRNNMRRMVRSFQEKWVTTGGYISVSLSKDDPFASMRTVDGRVLEHRINMARKLGRPLLPTETVHHRDRDRQNNDPDNLQLRQGKHGKHIAMCCLDCGSRRIGPCDIA